MDIGVQQVCIIAACLCRFWHDSRELPCQPDLLARWCSVQLLCGTLDEIGDLGLVDTTRETDAECNSILKLPCRWRIVARYVVHSITLCYATHINPGYGNAFIGISTLHRWWFMFLGRLSRNAVACTARALQCIIRAFTAWTHALKVPWTLATQPVRRGCARSDCWFYDEGIDHEIQFPGVVHRLLGLC